MDDVTAMESMENAVRYLLEREYRREAECLRAARDEWMRKADVLRLQLAQARETLDEKDDALESIVAWADAYPVGVFSEAVLRVLRPVLKEVASIASSALGRAAKTKPDES